MFDAFKRWWMGEDLRDPADDGARGPLPEEQPGDWVVLPFRIAEAARISIYTIGSHPNIPDELKVWISEWLQAYNAALSRYFGEVYGTDVYPVLEKITHGVREASERYYADEADQRLDHSFHLWESQLRDEDEHGG